jgi:hypothetical protein
MGLAINEPIEGIAVEPAYVPGPAFVRAEGINPCDVRRASARAPLLLDRFEEESDLGM